MLATHYAIQNEVIAARTETAHALFLWRICRQRYRAFCPGLENALRSSGDLDLSREMATRIRAQSGWDVQGRQIRLFAGLSGRAVGIAFLEAWVNGLLSSPPTHLVNMMSNTSVAFQQMYERAAAAQIFCLF